MMKGAWILRIKHDVDCADLRGGICDCLRFADSGAELNSEPPEKQGGVQVRRISPQNSPHFGGGNEERTVKLNKLKGKQEPQQRTRTPVAGLEREMTMESSDVAGAIERSLISPNEMDRNMEPANVVDALAAIARAINNLAKAVKLLGEAKVQ